MEVPDFSRLMDLSEPDRDCHTMLYHRVLGNRHD